MAGWEQVGREVEKDIDRMLAIIGGLVVLVVAGLVDLARHRHRAK